MDDVTAAPLNQPRRHLHPADRITPTVPAPVTDLTRRHGQGNGIRMHLIYFAAVSLAALVLVIVAIALVTR